MPIVDITVAASHPLSNNVARWLERHKVGDEKLVLAISGGPDSVALLRAILSVRPEQPLVLAHFNHLLRGPESDADEEFVRELHRDLSTSRAGVELQIERGDIAALARERHLNLEAAARRCRYDWLNEAATRTGACWIATGHTADDQAETVLHRLLRGTGIRGLRGIAPVRIIRPGLALIRPLLDLRRQEIREFLEGQQQPWREDSSNRDPRFLRNRLRHELLPLLEKEYSPAIRKLLAHLAEQAHEVFTELEERAGKLLTQAERPPVGTLRILDRGTLLQAPSHIALEALRSLWERAGWPTGQMDFGKWRRLLDLCREESGGLDLPGRIRARSRGNVLQLGPVTGRPPESRT